MFLLRSETIETYFILWRLTHDKRYRNWGWEVMEVSTPTSWHTPPPPLLYTPSLIHLTLTYTPHPHLTCTHHPHFTHTSHPHFTHLYSLYSLHSPHRLLRNTAVSTVGASVSSRTSITQVPLKMMYNKASWSLRHSSTSSYCIAMTQCYHWIAGCSTQRLTPFPSFQAPQEQIFNLN